MEIIIKKLLEILDKKITRKYCEQFIKDYEDYNSDMPHLTLNFWNNAYPDFAYQILDQFIYSNEFLQILKNHNTDINQFNKYLLSNRNITDKIDKYIQRIFVNFHNMQPLFITEEQIGRFKSSKELLKTIKVLFKRLLTWKTCKKIVDTKTHGENKYDAITITNLDDLDIDAFDLLMSYSNFIDDNNLDITELFQYLQDFNLHDELNQYVNNIFKSKDKEKPLLYEKKIVRLDPYEFYLQKDKIGDEQYSKRSPYEFSKDRTSPIILINDEVYTSNKIDAHHYHLIQDFLKKHNLPDDFEIRVYATGIFEMSEEAQNEYQVKNLAVGSNFNKVVLLEHYEGNLSEINATFLNHGFKKVYYNEDNAEIPHTYKRIARLKKLYKK